MWRRLFLVSWCVWFGAPSAFAEVASRVAGGDDAVVDIELLADSTAPADAVLAGEFDARFQSLTSAPARASGGAFWLKLIARAPVAQDGELGAGLLGAGLPEIRVMAISVHAMRESAAQVYAAAGSASPALLPLAATLPGFRFTQDWVYALREPLRAKQVWYAHFTAGEPRKVLVSAAPLERTLLRGADHARMIALAFGALTAMAMAALLIWFVLKDKLFLLYASLFVLQALYIAYLSGQGFAWPFLAWALPLNSFAWNVPVGLSGAVACLFTREIADLKHSAARAYAIFGWFAIAFVLVSLANVAKFIGLASVVAACGNLLFLVAALFTVVIAFIAWRRGNRAAGWFLIAWGLLEGFTIAATLQFLVIPSEEANPRLYYYGLPLSMVAAAVLIALGVADRLREQRAALSDAERRAQTDPLTGVLNRRSLLERLDAACSRARARGLPIAVLFIDLDHFKQINDTHGHAAGDACLRAIIDPIHTELRQSDVIGRYGGEEFVVILSSADAAAAHPIAERILLRVAGVRVPGLGVPIQLTCSIGVAASETLGLWGEQLVAKADSAAYAAKRAGRNQVHMAALAA